MGTPQELTDENGEVVWCNYEWAWGGRYTHFYKEQSLNGCAIIESDLQPIRFQGQSFDVETGLHYNRFRYYDSDVGMFIQRDPIGLLGGYNVYQYAPNPIHWIDPLGLNKTPAKDCCKKDECEKSDHLKKSCSQLLGEINDFLYRNKHIHNQGGTHGLVHRFKEQVNGKHGPGTKSWTDHEGQILGQQKGLRCRLKAYSTKGCGKPPANAWKYATKPVPIAKEWKGQSK